MLEEYINPRGGMLLPLKVSQVRRQMANSCLAEQRCAMSFCSTILLCPVKGAWEYSSSKLELACTFHYGFNLTDL